MPDTYQPVRQAFLAWQRTQPQQPLFFEIDAPTGPEAGGDAVDPAAAEPPTPLGGSARGTHNQEGKDG